MIELSKFKFFLIFSLINQSAQFNKAKLKFQRKLKRQTLEQRLIQLHI